MSAWWWSKRQGKWLPWLNALTLTPETNAERIAELVATSPFVVVSGPKPSQPPTQAELESRMELAS